MTAFIEFLKTPQVETVTVIGVAADYCVGWAIEGLVARGFGVTVREHLTQGIDRQIWQVVDEEFANLPVRLTSPVNT
ncbi:isochorismatase family protein [Novosphingobium mangrovi (ex Huang et al. 2023)]|uniref:Isochorismatase family protein n=1 Tax=Novosphingobium mangrovi (ex Huang et al. 2023) TaxID=2976432 RepID=A0ABT2I0Z8_9SPHN|nr:isochorismatase family protein [Novosphingobium mangrovi (ex Huang et al. 2023)]MCT2398482.1 isochorismatase family protein [Novosphingobium mangrovi (ex Huang et al. 2023)]